MLSDCDCPWRWERFWVLCRDQCSKSSKFTTTRGSTFTTVTLTMVAVAVFSSGLRWFWTPVRQQKDHFGTKHPGFVVWSKWGRANGHQSSEHRLHNTRFSSGARLIMTHEQKCVGWGGAGQHDGSQEHHRWVDEASSWSVSCVGRKVLQSVMVVLNDGKSAKLPSTSKGSWQMEVEQGVRVN